MAERAGLSLIKCLFKSNVFENYNWFPLATAARKIINETLREGNEGLLSSSK